MKFQEALEQALKDNSLIALPNSPLCEGNGYEILFDPKPKNLKCVMLYGCIKEINFFSIDPQRMLRDDWLVVNPQKKRKLLHIFKNLK